FLHLRLYLQLSFSLLFLNTTAVPTDTYPLSLHDALPIYYQTPQNYEYYGFAYMKIEEVTEDEVWLKFDGEGRWSWGDTLENIFSSDKFRSQINPYRDDLINRLYEDKEEIEMEYKDYEPGCE